MNINDITALAGLKKDPALSSGIRHLSSDKIDKAARDFEEVFLNQMLDQMFPEEMDPMGSKDSDEVYRGWMLEQYAKKMAQAGGIGIASHIKAELLKMQEMAQNGGAGRVTAVKPKFFNIRPETAPQISIER